MRYFIRLAYNGAAYHGWQSQPSAISVQQKIEEALSTVLRLPVSIVGAGRTDAGVHAREMFAHFDLPATLESCGRTTDIGKIILSLNRLLGKDIAIYDIFKVADDAHARFDACERTYKYFVTYDKTPFMHQLCWHSPSSLDLDKMNEAAAFLKITDDFTSFAKLHSDSKTNICDVRDAYWHPASGHQDMAPLMGNGIVFTISADRFLRNMVRAVVGTLVDVGRGKLSISEFKDIISKKDRCAAGTSMPAHALYLWSVKYPFEVV